MSRTNFSVHPLSLSLLQHPSLLLRCFFHSSQNPTEFFPSCRGPSLADFPFGPSGLLLCLLQQSSLRSFLGYGCPDVMPYHQDVVLIPHVGRDVWFQHPPQLDLGVASRTHGDQVG